MVAAAADGHYHFRVAPGRYSMRSPNAGGTEPMIIEAKAEAEIVRDIALKGPVREPISAVSWSKKRPWETGPSRRVHLPVESRGR